METKRKKLVINAAMCDLRGATEEKLGLYESVTVNAATVLVDARAQALLAAYPVRLNVADMLEVPDGEDVDVTMQNGAFTISAASAPAGAKRTVLIVNGTLTVEPDAGEALQPYLSIRVNGTVLCPETLAGALAGRLSVNGSMTVYPEGAVLLRRTFVVDGTFPMRAKAALYFAERRVVLLDPEAEPAALVEKGVRFKTREALLAKGLAAAAAPLFDDATELTVLPDGCAFVPDDATLNEALLRRYGPRLYVNGDLTLTEDSGPLLGRLEYLRVNGNVRLPAALVDAFGGIRAEYATLRVLRGRQLTDKPMLRIDRALLERNPDGLQVSDCAIVKLAADIPPELIEERLTFADCGVVRCTEEQEGAVSLVSEDVGIIGQDGDEGPGFGSVGELIRGSLGIGDVKCVNAANYRF